MTAIRDRARAILNAIPSSPIRSNDGTGNYARYTGGLTHATLVANWKPPTNGIMTGCNAFVGWYGAQLGSDKYLGRFDLASYLPSINRGHAWVRSATADADPQYGDILLHVGLHIDVALDFEGCVLNRMAAGQGGKGMGCDILCRVRGKGDFSRAKLQGWIDIDKYFGAAPAVDATTQWLQGWWSVWDGNQYYYYFGANGYVQYTKKKPTNATPPSAAPLNQGVYTLSALGALVINWNPVDGGATRETFGNARAGSVKLNGTSNRYSPLVATKI